MPRYVYGWCGRRNGMVVSMSMSGALFKARIGGTITEHLLILSSIVAHLVKLEIFVSCFGKILDLGEMRMRSSPDAPALN